LISRRNRPEASSVRRRVAAAPSDIPLPVTLPPPSDNSRFARDDSRSSSNRPRDCPRHINVPSSTRSKRALSRISSTQRVRPPAVATALRGASSLPLASRVPACRRGTIASTRHRAAPQMTCTWRAAAAVARSTVVTEGSFSTAATRGGEEATMRPRRPRPPPPSRRGASFCFARRVRNDDAHAPRLVSA
jgi:hypothetical protein